MANVVRSIFCHHFDHVPPYHWAIRYFKLTFLSCKTLFYFFFLQFIVALCFHLVVCFPYCWGGPKPFTGVAVHSEYMDLGHFLHVSLKALLQASLSLLIHLPLESLSSLLTWGFSSMFLMESDSWTFLLLDLSFMSLKSSQQQLEIHFMHPKQVSLIYANSFQLVFTYSFLP